MDSSRTIHGNHSSNIYSKKELERLIDPKSIAIIGASATPGSFGHRSVENTGFGYRGRVYPINPRHQEILGHRCYPSIESLPETPDCAVLSVPREQVLPLVQECAERGIGGVVIYSAGFAETGNAEGIAQEQCLASIAEKSGMRIVGPNCLGLMNFVNRVGMTFQPGLSALPMIQGPIGLVVQSGALGFILTQGMQRGLGFSYTFAPGNSCDVDTCDLINFLVEDDATRAIGCVLEGVRDGERLLQVAHRALAANKPLIVYKMGNNELGRRTALSHTGTLTGSLAAYQAAFARAGMVAVDDFESVLETVAFFAVAKKPSTRGVGVMSASGGAAIMAADKAGEVGVLLPPLAPQTSAKLRQQMPDFGSSANPCDITAASLHDKTMYGHCIRAFAEDPSFAAVVVPMMTANAPSTVERAEYLCKLAGALDKPVCIVWLNEWYQGPGSEVYDRSRELSIFRSMTRCMKTLKAWFSYYDQRDGLLSRPILRITGKDCSAQARAILAKHEPGQSLSERESKRLLAAYGVCVTREKLAAGEDDAVRFAQEIGYPVVLKAEAEAVTHKTEANLVRLNVKNAEEVRRAFNAIVDAAARIQEPAKLNGILVQEMVNGGVEVIVGSRQDPQFGPIIMCGLGGILVEIIKDTACSLVPVNAKEARRMLASLKGYQLLTGYRGTQPANIDLLADAICRISELAADCGGSIAELDVNPIIVSDTRAIAADALVVIEQPDVR